MGFDGRKLWACKIWPYYYDYKFDYITVLISFIAKIKVESLKKDMDRPLTILIWDYMTHQ